MSRVSSGDVSASRQGEAGAVSLRSETAVTSRAVSSRAPFVTTLRNRGATLDLSGGAEQSFVIRGQVHEAWDAVRMVVAHGTRVNDVKQAALRSLLGDGADEALYMVKVHGHEVHDESLPLSDAGVRAGTTVFVHSRRRRPIR